MQDSFSCSPRLPTFALDFALKQAHFLVGSVVVVVSVGLTLQTMFGISAKAASRTSASGSATVTGFFIEMKQQLHRNKATRLIVIGLVFTILFAVNLFVTVNTIPVLDTFKTNADLNQQCLISRKAFCGFWGTCVTTYDPDSPCTAHSDCIPETEYCQADGQCGRCYDCHLDENGVGGTCPTTKCRLDSKMDNREICAFENCGQEILAFSR